MSHLQEIIDYHLGGKIGVQLTKPLCNQKELSLAYTPGVAEICRIIEKEPKRLGALSLKGNSVAVITDGTAVLGLGDIGPRASIPVMEGKAALFKAFAGIDAWPVPIESGHDTELFISTVKAISCMYGGINLEDIAAPRCFEIEDRLAKELDIPVFHDDQWGTAVIVLAALENYALVAKKAPTSLKIIVNGAGAAGLRITQMIKEKGMADVTVCDKKGVLSHHQNDMDKYKMAHVRTTENKTLADAMRGADVFIGVSGPNCVSAEMVLSMNSFPAIFAMANPDPEIRPQIVQEALKGKPFVLATGRSDYPNQINNVLGFPYIFRGALDARATSITMNMKLAASAALAELARKLPVPKEVEKAYGRSFEFGANYLVPTPFDPRLNVVVSKAVFDAAIKDGVSS